MQNIQGKTNPINWLFRYFRESREELKKVSWPNKKTTVRYTTLIVVLSIAIAAFFGGFDWLTNQGLDYLITITS